MKIRKGFELLQDEIKQLLFWYGITKRDKILQSKDYVLNILRVFLYTDFIDEVEKLRKTINLPARSQLENDPDERGVTKWLEKHPDAPQGGFDSRIQDLCNKYQLDPIRYADFVDGYLYYWEAHPFLPLNISPMLENEAKYKSKLEFIYENGNDPKAGYIRFYKDTTPNQLIQFVKANSQVIRQWQKSLTKYPHQKSHHMGTFVEHIRIFLLYIKGHTDREINKIIRQETKMDIDEDRIRKIISEMKKTVRNCLSTETTSVEQIDRALQYIAFLHLKRKM